jgi:hypothetical protein
MTDAPELQRMSLEEARQYLATEAELIVLDELSEYQDVFSDSLAFMVRDSPKERELGRKYLRLRELLEARVVQKLHLGEWFAWGVKLPLRTDSRPELIESWFWKHLDPDFENSAASGHGLDLVDIQISPSVRGANAETADGNSGYLLPLPKIESYILLSDDNEILEIHSVALDLLITVILKGKIQQSIMRQLVDAFHKGKRLKTSMVLERAGSAADSIAKAFNGNSNWRDLKRVIKQEKGYTTLEI